jgi:ribosomal protein L37E
MTATNAMGNMDLLVSEYKKKSRTASPIMEAWLGELSETVAAALSKQEPRALRRSDGTQPAAFICPGCGSDIFSEHQSYCQICGQRIGSWTQEARGKKQEKPELSEKTGEFARGGAGGAGLEAE